MNLPERVTICEVGPRDGFQIEPEFIPTAVPGTAAIRCQTRSRRG